MPRILHLGLGNFHRAHQAWYTAQAGGGWTITGVVMRNGHLYDAMRTQRGYALGIRDTDGLRVEWIDIHDRVLLAARQAAQVIAAFVDPDLHIITLTITEKGYCLSSYTGTLDLTHPQIAGDIANAAQAAPDSAIGLLAHGLARRFEAGLPPLTILSCDNISGNGGKLAAAVSRFAEAASLSTSAANRFPDTMVDRITPATTDAIRTELSEHGGRTGTEPVLTEAFSQWTIEDRFAGPRPAWETAGADLVRDVAPFEMRKLRLLNAAHSYLAYSGMLAGHRYVHQAIADPHLRDGVERLWDEAVATLPDVARKTAPAYRAALIERFSVAGMCHELAQIGMDGSTKLKERIVPLLDAPHPTPQAVEAVAAWIMHAKAMHAEGIALNDPMAADITAILQRNPTTPDLCSALARLVGIQTTDTGLLDNLAERVARQPH